MEWAHCNDPHCSEPNVRGGRTVDEQVANEIGPKFTGRNQANEPNLRASDSGSSRNFAELGLQTKPSVQRLMPLSPSSKMSTEPDVIILRSESTKRRVTRGMKPRLAASRMSRASPVVSIHPDQGGSVQVLDCWMDADGPADIATAHCWRHRERQ